MQCPQCQHDNPEGARFCNACGAKLEATCPACEHTNPPGSRFCNACGHNLSTPSAISSPPDQQPATAPQRDPVSYTPQHLAEKILTSRSALEGERKQVTVLFADVAGFTDLARQLDPEVVHEVMDHCFALIAAEIHRFEGTINQYTGDGVMALFGAPIAHEDGPRRAVHAALGIQRAMWDFGREIEAQHGLRFQMRIGINTGLVVVGRIGDDLRMDYTAVGDTTNLASRLQQLAQPGRVVISESTYRLVEGFFETYDLGTHRIKGHPEPVHAFEVIQARGRRSRLEIAAEQGLTPHTGRERELATLMDRFQQVKAGSGQVVFLVGEAGMGKSRHLLEFHQALRNAGEAVTWLEGRCLSFGHAMPFLPIVDQLRINFGIEESDGEPEIIAKVDSGMRRMGQLEPHIPAIRYLLAADPGDDTLADMEPAARRKHLVDAVVSLSLRGAQLRPLVLIYEDLHWIDSSTEEFLGVLLDAVAGVSILLILTYRPGYTPPYGSRSFYTTLALQSLSASDTLKMAGRILGTEALPQAIKTLLLEKTEGVPLFVEEMIKTLRDMGTLQQENGVYRLVGEQAEIDVPDTIQGMIMARLDHLGEGGKRTVQLASVIGRQFLVRLLERISDLSGQLDGLLSELQALEIIFRQGLLPEPAYVFKHAVIQDVAYNSLLVRQRRALHSAVGYAIEELYPDRLAEHYEELAHHFTEGEIWAKAMAYSVLAGDRATETYANAEAKVHYAHALGAAMRLTPPPDPGTVARLHAKHATILEGLGEFEDAVTSYQQALDLIRQFGDRRGEVDILVGLSGIYNAMRHGESATTYSEQALALAQEIDDPACLAACLTQLAAIRWVATGHIVEATSDGEEALRLARNIGDPKTLSPALLFLGMLLQWRADFDRALTYLHEGFELTPRMSPGSRSGASFIGDAYVATGAYETALHWYEMLADYAAKSGDKFAIVRAPNYIGGVHLELYDFDEALRLNLESDTLAQQIWPWPEPRGHALVKAGLAHLYRDEHGQAEASFRRAEALLETDTWMRWRWHIVLLRARGELALAHGQHDEAWTYATRSLELAAQSDSRKHIARAQWLQGKILMAGGRLDEAIQTLQTSIHLAEQIGTPRELWLGKAALAQALMQLRRDKEAEIQLTQAAQAIETIVADLRTPRLHNCYLNAAPVVEVYHTLGRRPPSIIA